MSDQLRYIIVDDDPFNNKLCDILIKTTLTGVNIKTFTVPEEALEFIMNDYIEGFKRTILLLDINMPTLSGWEFIEYYGNLSEVIKKQISIYILSSSVSQSDKDKAEANKYVKGFFSKPLDRDTISAINDL